MQNQNYLVEERKQPKLNESQNNINIRNITAPNNGVNVAIKMVKENLEQRRRGSMVEPRTEANQELFKNTWKQVRVRIPRLGRSKSIVVSSLPIINPGNFPISSLNYYNSRLRKQRGPVSLCSSLEQIEEDESYDNDDFKGEIPKDNNLKEFENDQNIAASIQMKKSRSF